MLIIIINSIAATFIYLMLFSFLLNIGQRSARYLQNNLRAFAAQESGAVMPFTVLIFVAALAITAYSFDSSRMVDSFAQVKRATDAAAMAIGYKEIASGNSDSTRALLPLAKGYIKNNLGLDSQLNQQVDLSSVNVVRAQQSDGSVTYQVGVSVTVSAQELGTQTAPKTIASTVKVMSRPTEVSLMLPNTNSESSADIAALKRLGKTFADEFINNGSSSTSDSQDNKRWLALVPYSQSVNVYDADDEDRISRWAASGELNPPELRSLFRTGKVNSLADERFPDRIAHLLCMFRGLGSGENYFWNQAPSSQFGVYYRTDLPENGSPGADPISWEGPNPELWPDSTAIDTRWIVADRGCPNTPLLPLSNDTDAIDSRLDEMQSRFNVNYAIAMGWAAMSLSPQFRGSDGWGDNELPLDYSATDDNYKAIIMLANTTGDWFDTDSYNFYRDDDSSTTSDSTTIAKQRFINLCRSFRAQNIHLYLVGVRPGDPDDFGRTLFDQVAGPGLLICTEGQDNMHFANASGFAEGEDQVESALEDIAKDIRRNYYVRLIK